MRRTQRFKVEIGFTLLETLTAMMILAISLVTIFQLFSGGLNSVRKAENYSRAVLYAREKMDELLLRKSMSDSDLQGDFGSGYVWQAQIRNLTQDRSPSTPPHMFHLSVGVGWGPPDNSNWFYLETIHIARKVASEKAS